MSAILTLKQSTVLGHYQLKEVLGQGGMGIVYLAEDKRLKRLVAIKCLKPEIQQSFNKNNNKKHYKRLQKEARLLAQLNHSNIVQIYDVIDTQQEFALVMEYIKGNTLAVHLREHITSLKQRLTWLLQIAQGLAAAHAKGLIHRDLKTDNILINTDNVAKITDFGIAQNLNHNHTILTQTQSFLGSYSSLSPEQALGEPLDERSDLFSFGIIAYTLLNGYHPFGNTNNHNVLVQNILHNEPLLAKNTNNNAHQHLNEHLINLIAQLLKKDKQQRPDSARYIAQQLYAYIENDYHESNESNFSQTIDFEKQNYKKNFFNTNKKLTFNFITIGIILLSVGIYYSYINFIETPKDLYVAILPPIINSSNQISEGQQQLLSEVFNSTLQQQIIETKNLHLISQQNIKNTGGNYAQRANALAADVLIESVITCQQQRCEVELNRIEAKTLTTKNNSSPQKWVIAQQQRWPLIVDMQLLNISAELQQRTIHLFPHHQFNLLNSLLNENEYREFLDYRHSVLNQISNNDQIWQELWKLQTRYQYYLPYYELMSYLGRALYDDSNNSYYLEKLNNLLKKGTRHLGSNVDLLINQFEVALYQQKFTKADLLLLKIKEHSQDKATLLTLEGTLENFRGNYQKANYFYQQALSLRSSTKLLYRIANNNYHRGNYTASIASLNTLLRLNPVDQNAKTLIALVYLLDGQINKSISLYKQLIINSPNSSFYNNLGLAYELLGKFAHAEQFFTKALQLDSNNNLWRLNLADSLLLQKKYISAKKQYMQIIVTSHNKESDLNAQLNIALAEIQLGHTTNALQAIHRSIRLAGDNAEVLFNAAIIYSLAEQWPVALSYIEQSLQLDISPIWFTLPWFDELCIAAPKAFNELLAESANKKNRILRCSG